MKVQRCFLFMLLTLAASACQRAEGPSPVEAPPAAAALPAVKAPPVQDLPALPEAPAEAPEAPAKAPAEPVETPEAPPEAPAELAKAPEEPAETPEAPPEPPEVPAETPEAPAEAPAEPAETPEAPVETPAELAEAPEVPPEPPEAPAEAPVELAEAPEEPAEPAEAPAFDPASITPEVFQTTKTEVQRFMVRLNAIIRAKNFTGWTSNLAASYLDALNSPDFLQQVSGSSFLQGQGIVVKNAQDYFFQVVVPSRANSRVDDIEFISPTRVKAYTITSGGQRLRLYELEHSDGAWKIIN